jgi:hypothetical protein
MKAAHMMQLPYRKLSEEKNEPLSTRSNLLIPKQYIPEKDMEYIDC